MNRIYRLPLSLLFALLPLCALFFTTVAKAQVTTTTVLAVNQACLTEGCVVTLTATVTAGGNPVHPGLVTFCDKGPTNCENEAPIGRAQLMANGTATIRIGLSTGTHSLRAIFHGTKTYNSSSSTSHSATASAGAVDRAVTSYPPTVAETNGGFQFTTNSLVLMGQVPPTGSVSFLDTTQNNLNLGSSPIVPGTITQSFSNPNGPPFGAQSFAETILAGDFNNDGKLDAAEVDTSGLLTVGLGDGAGNFTQGPAFIAQQTGDIAPSTQLPGIVGDFNSDGKLDIALPDTTSTMVRILLGNGDGTFTAAPTTAVTQSSQMLVLGDFNNDGIPDLISVSTRGSAGSYLEVLLGKGDGTFTAGPKISLANDNLVWASAGDFNHDGSQDITFGYYTGTYTFGTAATTLAVLKGNGDGSFVSTPAASYPQNLSILATGDFDGDGIPDIMTGGTDPSNGFTPTVIAYYRGNGDFTFSNKSISIYPLLSGFIPGDYLGNGMLEVATSLNLGVELIEGSATDGPVLGPVPLGGSAPYASGVPTVGDFNNDGLIDILDVYYGFDVPSTPPTLYANSFSSVATAVSPVISLPLGDHQIAASYSGDANHSANLSPTANVYSAGISYGSGFGTAPSLTLNGSATLNNGAISLTNGGEFQVGTFFTNNRINLGSGFTSNFDFQIPVANADGFAYVVQDDGPNAIGSSGGGLGYGNPPGGTGTSIPNSFAVAFDTHNNQGEGANSMRLEYNGVTTGTGAVDLTGHIDLHSGHRFHVQIQTSTPSNYTYVFVVITDTQTQATFSNEFYFNTPNVTTNGWAYIGFTSATGASTVAPTIYDWTLDQGGPTSGFDFTSGFIGAASSLALNHGSVVSGSALDLTTGTPFEATSSYAKQTIIMEFGSNFSALFSTDFDFNVGDGNGDGFTFVLQDHSATAVGSSGGGLGYGVDYLTPAPPPGAIIPSSLAIKFDLHNNHGEGANSTGLYINGASPTTPSLDLTPSGINLHSGHTFHANITRTGESQVTLSLTDLTVYKVFQTTFNVSNPSVLQSFGAVYAGFTAGTGATSDTIKILNWSVLSAD